MSGFSFAARELALKAPDLLHLDSTYDEYGCDLHVVKGWRSFLMSQSSIEWTFRTWNPVTGCSKVSAGCEHCYAERMARRLKAMGVAKYANGFEVTTHPDVLEDPLKWRKPQLIFVNSMSDLFHEKIPFKYVRRIFEARGACQICTEIGAPVANVSNDFGLEFVVPAHGSASTME